MSSHIGVELVTDPTHSVVAAFSASAAMAGRLLGSMDDGAIVFDSGGGGAIAVSTGNEPNPDERDPFQPHGEGDEGDDDDQDDSDSYDYGEGEKDDPLEELLGPYDKPFELDDKLGEISGYDGYMDPDEAHGPTTGTGPGPEDKCSANTVTVHNQSRNNCWDLPPYDCGFIPLWEGVYYKLTNSCEPYADMFCMAYRIILDNYDVVTDWFELVGKSGKAFKRHFDGRKKTRFRCSSAAIEESLSAGIGSAVEAWWEAIGSGQIVDSLTLLFCETGNIALAVAPDILICPSYLDRMRWRWDEYALSDMDKRTCMALHLAGLIIHETYHIAGVGHWNESTAWSFEAYFRARVTRRYCLAETAYCCTLNYPLDGNWKEECTLKQIKKLVEDFLECG